MSKKDRSIPFLERYLRGKSLADDIDDFIDAWHEGTSKAEIFEFLGMTKEEYALWLRDPDMLTHIARARRLKMPLSTIVRDEIAELPVAARSANSAKVNRLKLWLEEEGIFLE